jgi:hypothetical protein
MTSSIIPEQFQRKAVIQPAHDEAPRPARKNRLRRRKIDAFSNRKRLDFGAATCSKRSSEPCAEQNHLREKVGEIAKSKNRVQPGSAPHRIASL